MTARQIAYTGRKVGRCPLGAPQFGGYAPGMSVFWRGLVPKVARDASQGRPSATP